MKYDTEGDLVKLGILANGEPVELAMMIQRLLKGRVRRM